MGYKAPIQIQTTEKHDAIYERYQEINRELIEEHGKNVASEITARFKYEKLADEFYMAYSTINRIICRKLKENAKNR